MADECDNVEPMAFTPSADPDDPCGPPAPIVYSDRDFAMFLAALDADEEPTEALRGLFARHG